MKKRVFVTVLLTFAIGLASGTANSQPSQSEEASEWDESFKIVEIKSSIDGAIQKAYAFEAQTSEAAPLVVSLHTWSHDYTQYDRLTPTFKANNIHYIHPNFRGQNVSPEACASPLSLQDIDDAIAYCLKNWNVDPNKIVIVGESGGGHATCSMYFKSKYNIKAFYAWASISDIETWYQQTKQRELKYAGEIEQILGGSFNQEGARKRSPLYMPFKKRKGKLHLFAGINDGYTGSVPTSQSIRLFNRFCDESNKPNRKVSPQEQVSLLSKSAKPSGELIQDRAIYLQRESSLGSLTVFEGTHEMLVQYCTEAILAEFQ